MAKISKFRKKGSTFDIEYKDKVKVETKKNTTLKPTVKPKKPIDYLEEEE